MKKIFIIVILLNTFTVFSQKFELTPNGFVDSEDHSKNYIVIEFPSKTKEELLNETMIYLTKNYVSANDVINKVNEEVITISAYSSNQITLGYRNYTNKYIITFSFKDSKVKIDSPLIELSYGAGENYHRLHISYLERNSLSNDGIFAKKNKLKHKRPKDDLELFANKFVLSYKDGLSEEDKNEDW